MPDLNFLTGSISGGRSIWLGRLQGGQGASHRLTEGRGVWVQVLAGTGEIAGERLAAGDGAAIEEETTVTIRAADQGLEVLLFDLP